ncbi:inhibitor of cysteine protease 1 [Cystoisospora suis]|uniref:Inhibitor of cysteine protease 1 n=1 Tax=Cystoisospora suis TaxID=483139 RepID=A0A2C6LIN6_9APIC|nr:inhibitor of cysteine protease 1 [Cystoisospora suis]
MASDGEKLVTFSGSPSKDNVYETNVDVDKVPSKIRVEMKGTGGSGGYLLSTHDIYKGLTELPKLEIPKLSEEEMKEKIEAPSMSKHGLTVSKPSIQNVKSMPGSPQLFSSVINVEEAGDYTAVFAHFRPWNPSDSSTSYYVVHIHAH